MEVLRFELEGVVYGIPAAHVREVVRAVAVTPLAGAPRVVDGLINLRGVPVPVLDLRARLGREPRPVSPAEQWLITQIGERTVALRADRAVDLVALDDQRVQHARSLVPAAQIAAGVATLDDGLVVIFDPERFLTRAEADTLDRALREEGAA